jgi:hypothetical protein
VNTNRVELSITNIHVGERYSQPSIAPGRGHDVVQRFARRPPGSD